MQGGNTLKSASRVEPRSIQFRAAFGAEAELLVRSRPPGGVDLPRGQREHMLLLSVGSPVDGSKVQSVLRTEDRRHDWNQCPQGHVTFVPAGFPFQWDWSYQSDSVHLTLLPSFLEGVSKALAKGDDSEQPILKPLFRVMDQELGELLRHLEREARDEFLGKDLVTSSLLTQIAVRIQRLCRSGEASWRPPVALRSLSAADRAHCTSLLERRLDERIPLAELAAEVGLSPYHFSRQFKKATGFPPHEYQLQLRVARARILLREAPARSIADLAVELGFSDESHFRRHFKRIVGLTPGRFRAQQ